MPTIRPEDIAPNVTQKEIADDLMKNAGSYMRGARKPWWYVGDPSALYPGGGGDRAQVVKATLILAVPVLVVLGVGLLLVLRG